MLANSKPSTRELQKLGKKHGERTRPNHAQHPRAPKAPAPSERARASALLTLDKTWNCLGSMHMSTILAPPLTLMVSSPLTSGHRLARPVPFTCVYESESSLSRLMASDGGAVNRERPAKIASAPVAAFLKPSDAADISSAEVEAARVGAPAIRAPLKALVGAKASAEGLSAEIATAITASFMVGRESNPIATARWWWQLETVTD